MESSERGSSGPSSAKSFGCGPGPGPESSSRSRSNRTAPKVQLGEAICRRGPTPPPAHSFVADLLYLTENRAVCYCFHLMLFSRLLVTADSERVPTIIRLPALLIWSIPGSTKIDDISAAGNTIFPGRLPLLFARHTVCTCLVTDLMGSKSLKPARSVQGSETPCGLASRPRWVSQAGAFQNWGTRLAFLNCDHIPGLQSTAICLNMGCFSFVYFLVLYLTWSAGNICISHHRPLINSSIFQCIEH